MEANLKRHPKVFQEGDLVLVHLQKNMFPAGEYHKLQAGKFGPFPIKKRINDNAYEIALPASWNIASTFNVADLFEYNLVDAVSSSSLQLNGRVLF